MISIPWTARIALRALRVNKMRSALTMLGIIIGVGAVIAMLAVGTGASRQIAEQMATMGSNLLIILPGSQTSGGVRMGFGSQTTLTLGDAEAIQKECPAVQDVAPIHNGTAQIVYGNLNWSTGVIGTTGGHEQRQGLARRLRAAHHRRGREERDEGRHPRPDRRRQPFRRHRPPRPDREDQEDTLQGDRGHGGEGTIGHGAGPGRHGLRPRDHRAEKAFRHRLPRHGKADHGEGEKRPDLDPAEKQVTELLRQRHHIGAKKDDDFSVRNLTQMMQAAEQQTKIMTLLLGAIASVSLLVGGIGIMNIMLVSVTERTREIGIRMAVGAKTWDIRLQFIMEAIILSLIGGIVGLIAGVTGSQVLSMAAGWRTVVSPFSALLAFAFSGMVGIFFGFYPAYKASLLNPIDALRYE